MQQDQVKKEISILGCGWLGLPLAQKFIRTGYLVKGSIRCEDQLPDLEEQGIVPFQICITDKEIKGSGIRDFLNSETLIINFPPERREDIEQYHRAQFELLIEEVKHSKIQNILFVSSTSVYPDLNREVFENEATMPDKGSGKALKVVENMLLDQTNFKTTILRFGGLIGYDRMPGRFLAGKKNVENGNSPVNLIHQDDCVEVIYQIIKQDAWGEIFNACADKHPTRKEYYIKAATLVGAEPPTFAVQTQNKYKIINSDKIKNYLSYQFKYPDPLELLDSQLHK